MITRHQLQDFFNECLAPHLYSDYGSNGLQIEGCANLSRIAFAVSATRDSITKACEKGAQALVVHHGLFWSFHGAKTITGAFANRIKPAIKHDLNLFAYHLPLDGHKTIGNAAVLGTRLGVKDQQPFGDYKGMPTGICGVLSEPMMAAEFSHLLEQTANHQVIVATPDPHKKITSVAIITGGANGEWITAARQGLDAYVTGEISEHDWHNSQEHDVHMFAAGHHATEQFGIQALMELTRQALDVECFYINSDNPA